jgi:hypothetical protein
MQLCMLMVAMKSSDDYIDVFCAVTSLKDFRSSFAGAIHSAVELDHAKTLG